MKLEAEFHAANVFWQEARERVLGRAHFLCVPLELREHDDEFLYDLFDNGATIPTDEQIDKALRELFQETLQGAHNRFPCYVCTMKSQGTGTPRCARYKECHLWLNWAKKVGVSPEVKPQAPYQADYVSVQPTALDSVEYLRTHLEKVGPKLWRRCEPYEECVVEVYIAEPGRCLVRYQMLLGEIIWSEYTTAVTLKAYLKALFDQEHLGPLEN